ncbi:MAG: COR domain-containing protein, partial [Anaerolineales bacterium]|nr:COR domain-containing protein [Anaerolineales bacterium]
CLMDALLGDTWQEHPSTHGIEIKSFSITNPDTQTEITLNGWDFGGQRVYRPTHQLFFSAPAVYLVVWKPREGPQQGFVKEWIKLVKHREPDAKILVVATHGGPQQRQPDIDRQELWDLFGRETVADFFFVDSKPDAHGNRKGIEELKLAIARLAAGLPEVGRSVPKSFQDVREALGARSVPYLPLDEVLAICRAHKMDDEIARLFITISHRLGHLTHYQHDPALRDIVILRPDWLATAISYIFDDEVTRAAHGLVRFSRLNHLWDDPTRPADTRYPESLHRIFIALMGRFDLSYRVADSTPRSESDPQYLIAQLVPDNRPENFATAWISSPSSGDLQQTQICRIVDEKGNTAAAEGLFYQLIVRLHKYSLGRAAYEDSVHWQRGLVLDDDYNGRALLEHKGNDVHITVRAPYPERFLAMLTEEVKYLVESFWEGLRCDVMVPCLNETPCIGLFEVRRLIENKKGSRPEQPCPVCNVWQNIDSLLLNAPAARPVLTGEALANQAVLDELSGLRHILITQDQRTMGRFDNLDASQKELLSKADASYNSLMQIFTDEAKEGPRLFSMRPVDPKWLEIPKKLVSQKFRILLWCEHSQLPLFVLNKDGDMRGIYELDLPYEWVVQAAPYLKALTATLSLILPIASFSKFIISEDQFKSIEKGLSFAQDVFDPLVYAS